MSETSEECESVVYPMMDWRVAIGVTLPKVCLLKIVFARNLKEAKESTKGGDLPSIPLGITATQSRELAADLMRAANQLDGGKEAT